MSYLVLSVYLFICLTPFWEETCYFRPICPSIHPSQNLYVQLVLHSLKLCMLVSCHMELMVIPFLKELFPFLTAIKAPIMFKQNLNNIMIDPTRSVNKFDRDGLGLSHFKIVRQPSPTNHSRWWPLLKIEDWRLCRVVLVGGHIVLPLSVCPSVRPFVTLSMHSLSR